MKLYLLLLIAFLPVISYSQGHKTIRWNRDSLLTWHDFSGPVDTSVHHSAFSAIGMGYRYDQQSVNGKTKYIFSTASYFYRTKSWCLPNAQTTTLLKHEQLHFDIAEYFARQLLIVLNSLSEVKEPEQQIFASYRQIKSAMDKLQNSYDAFTNHGANLAQQKRWEQYVNILLESNTPLNEALNTPLIPLP